MLPAEVSLAAFKQQRPRRAFDASAAAPPTAVADGGGKKRIQKESEELKQLEKLLRKWKLGGLWHGFSNRNAKRPLKSAFGHQLRYS
jgi:hypothetical protein